MTLSFCRVFVLTVCLLLCGCATTPYHITSAADYPGNYPLAKNNPVVVKGNPSPILDASGWYWPGSLLGKLLLWNAKVDSHEISDETVQYLVQFCREHELGDVKIRVNAYSSGDEWHRTFSNENIHPLWRYPFGFVAWLEYTILPGRFFGGDNYNPFSNIYSDLKPITLHEAGHAQDFAKQKDKGLYAALYMIPFVNLYHEGVATSTALSYTKEYKSPKDQKEAFKLLYPAYGTYVGGDIGQYLFASVYWPVYLGGVAVGHIAGQTSAACVPDEPVEKTETTANNTQNSIPLRDN